MNPYGPPGASPYSPSPGYGPQQFYASGGAGAGVSEATVQLLLQTRPWVRFLSVLAFIASAFMLLAGVLGLVGGLAGMAAVNAMGHKGVPSGFAFLSLLYIPFAFLAIYPGMKLWAYGSAISRLALSRSPQDLEAAIGHQKSYWKFAGIMAIVVIILQVIGIGIAMVAGAALFSQLPNQ